MSPVVRPKGWTGHTLGAAGITEAVISCMCITQGLVPTNLNMRSADPTLTSQIVHTSVRRPVDRVLSNSFAFGGNNCTIILGRMP